MSKQYVEMKHRRGPRTIVDNFCWSIAALTEEEQDAAISKFNKMWSATLCRRGLRVVITEPLK